MRFDQINIPAFGPFTDFQIEFEKSEYDIHLIHGPNEAGKSSLLRAIRGLLYGIPSTTKDSHLHPNKKLLIGATLSEGEKSLTFFRRKGSKNTLLAEDRSTLNDAALAPFLGPVNQDFFENMFGLTTESLRSGAASLLSGKGDLGSAIFAASLGGSPINLAIQNLELEAQQLFKPQGTKSTINRAIADYRKAILEAQKESQPTNDWKTLKTKLQQVEAEVRTHEEALKSHRQRWEFVNCCLQALPVLAKKNLLEAKIADIDLPLLRPDFSDRVRETQTALAQILHDEKSLNLQLETLSQEIAEITPFEEVLKHSAELETLHRKAEAYHQDLEQIDALTLKEQTLKNSLGNENDLIPELDPTASSTLKEIAADRDTLLRETEALQKERDDLDIEQKLNQESLSKLTQTEDLDQLTELCRLADDFTLKKKGHDKQKQNLNLKKEEQTILKQRLGISQDPRKIKVASAQEIRNQEQLRQNLKENLDELRNSFSQTRSELSQEKASLAHLAKSAAIYTESDLINARKKRDQRWNNIKNSKEIDEQLSQEIRQADEIADTLRRDASRLATAANHQAKIATLEAKLKSLTSEGTVKKAAFEKWQNLWNTNFAQIENQLPEDLLRWREEWQELCQLDRDIRTTQQEITEIEEEEISLLKTLKGDDFDEIHRLLKSTFNQANRDQGERTSLQKRVSQNEIRIAQLSNKDAQLAKDLAETETLWIKNCQKLELDPQASSTVTLSLINHRQKTRETQLNYQDVKTQLSEYQKRRNEYEDLLKSISQALKSDSSEPSLHALYEKSKDDRQRSITLSEQHNELVKKKPKLELQRQSQSDLLEELKSLAKVDDLESALPLIQKRNDFEKALQEQEEILNRFKGEQEISDFISELEQQSEAELKNEKEGLDKLEAHLQQTRDQAQNVLTDLRRQESDFMSASDLSAHHKQGAANAHSEIVSDSKRFCQLQHAIKFLKQQVEDYRQKTQGPMVEKTSHFFQILTEGGFSKVIAQLDKYDVPQLIAVRADQTEVEINGLSEGTADQLYLALRFAAIDLHLENHHSIPLILDDLLMTFDDKRVKALVPILKEFGKKGQVLIFTHHNHLQKLLGKHLSYHSLSSAS